jgi:hypothetical protein
VVIVVVLLVVRGWGTPSGTSWIATLGIAISVLLLASLYIAMGGWYLNDRNPQSTTYVYDSPPGLLICFLHCALSVWVVVETAFVRWFERRHTLRLYFTLLGALHIVYFAMLPICVGVGLTLPDYQDERVVEISVCICTIIYYILATLLFRPGFIGPVFVYNEPARDLQLTPTSGYSALRTTEATLLIPGSPTRPALVIRSPLTRHYK